MAWRIAVVAKRRTKKFADCPPAGSCEGGVAGNYRGCCRSRSQTEFTARMGVVLEKADESELWLDVCDEKQWGRPLRAIFSEAYDTAKSREPKRRR